jgi:hypothetical protein
MDRKTAIAAAIAITMSVGSGAIALGANAGALGFSRPAPVAATQTVAPTAAGGARPTTRTAASHQRELDDSARTTDQTSTSAKGEHSD